MTKIDNFKLEHFDNGISIYQSDNYYKFTQDAILLAKFCNIKHSDNVLELCAGSGVISFYAYSLCPFNHLYFNEIQPEMCEIIEENIKFNGFKRRSKIFNCNLKDLSLSDFSKPLDVIICNPPYQKVNANSLINEKPEIAVARHEILATLEDIIKKSSELLKDKGRLYMVHLASRATEVISLCSKYNIEVKRMKLIFNGEKEAYLVLIEAVKNAQPGVRISKNKETK
ncbi:MAG TPA: methyltransferase [Candidatus Onthoplasma faecigallinarum]|nr:methyltransferase [Candidatus Onthoplasma faecigallinarum]